ncbi:hypothetical protein [Nostoc sphaeroides]|uniref:Uncharacterized protein n=1 Tax=Nostoc sphaeroides CCNUC1 TaxID=2653204 RepID=A0A5P8W259_9NOSO|nr:hypothetical protein [Nostoc sphaeroides]QFS46817.1 hypothetical protein GXM_04298 [Nostoc sphaeroides CCNUC1]
MSYELSCTDAINRVSTQYSCTDAINRVSTYCPFVQQLHQQS